MPVLHTLQHRLGRSSSTQGLGRDHLQKIVYSFKTSREKDINSESGFNIVTSISGIFIGPRSV